MATVNRFAFACRLLLLLSLRLLFLLASISATPQIHHHSVQILHQASLSTHRVSVYHVDFAMFLLNVTDIVVTGFDGQSYSNPLWRVTSISEITGLGSLECAGELLRLYHIIGGNDDIRWLHLKGYLMPQLHPHSETSLAHHIFSERPDLASISSSQQLLFVIPLAFRFRDREEIHIPVSKQDSIRAQWRLQPLSAQHTWPLLSIRTGNHALSGTLLLRGLSGPLTAAPFPSNIPIASSIFVDTRQLINGCSRHPDSDSMVTSFIQIDSLHKAVGAALKMVMEPVAESVTGNVKEHVRHTFTSDVSEAINARSPPQIIELTKVPMKQNMSNLVGDAAAGEMTQLLTQTMTNDLGPGLESRLGEFLPPQIHQDLQNVLTNAVGRDIVTVIPEIMQRAIKIALTPLLTKSLTHSISGALTVSLAHNRDVNEDQYCMSCFVYHQHCTRCRTSTISTYYHFYYAAYYSDYFSNYYAEYYQNALIAMDNLENPG